MDADGRIVVPVHLRSAAGNKTVRVRVTAQALSVELKRRNVTDEEIERIEMVQKEQRVQVLKFLLTEGSLAQGFRKDEVAR